jgi:hypothetical protein
VTDPDNPLVRALGRAATIQTVAGTLNDRAYRWSRLGRAFRAVLCALLVLGLLPGSHELVENLVHLAHDGHLAHSEVHESVAESEHCEPDAEHGCTPLSHQCACCISLAALPALPQVSLLPLWMGPGSPLHAHPGPSPRLRSLDPPYHPPIA